MAFWVLCKLIAILYTHILEISERSEEDSATSFLSFVSLLHIHYRMFPKQNGGKREMFSIAYSIMNVNKSIQGLSFVFHSYLSVGDDCVPHKTRLAVASLRGIFCSKIPQLCHIYVFLKVCMQYYGTYQYVHTCYLCAKCI